MSSGHALPAPPPEVVPIPPDALSPVPAELPELPADCEPPLATALPEPALPEALPPAPELATPEEPAAATAALPPVLELEAVVYPVCSSEGNASSSSGAGEPHAQSARIPMPNQPVEEACMLSLLSVAAKAALKHGAWPEASARTERGAGPRGVNGAGIGPPQDSKAPSRVDAFAENCPGPVVARVRRIATDDYPLRSHTVS